MRVLDTFNIFQLTSPLLFLVTLSRTHVSLAILGDGLVDWRPKQFSYQLCDCEINFRFPTRKLLDLNQQWSELEASPNPFAIVVMTHLKANETRQDSRRRKEWKLTLTKRLYEQDYQREDIINLFRFIDWVMSLSEELEQEFEQELNQYEEEKQMPYVTSIERRGIQKGQASTVLRQLKRKFGELSLAIEEQIQEMKSQQLENLSEALLDFEKVEDLINWLA